MPLSENRAALHLWMNGLHVGIWARGARGVNAFRTILSGVIAPKLDPCR
jgi:hypothetical protein